MKKLYLKLFFVFAHTSGLAQIGDTCEYISANNNVGGLDCAVVCFLNPNFEASYQWLNCSDNYAMIDGQTADWYSGMTSIYVSVVVTYQNCVDTSECYYACTANVNQLEFKKPKLIRIVDLWE